MKRSFALVMIVFVAMVVCVTGGCSKDVPAGHVGRVKTAGGWSKDLLAPGRHACWGRDDMLLCQATEKAISYKLSILTQDNINLNCTVTVRGGLDADRPQDAVQAFDRVPGGEDGVISAQTLFDVFVAPEAQSAPRDIIGQLTIREVMANRQRINADIGKAVMAAVAKTPMSIRSVRVTNYDWPDSITREQELLMAAKIGVDREKARVEAQLESAKGELAVAQAKRAVEVENASAVAEANKIIGSSLKDNPEYLQWHTVKVLSEAAAGPNNAFILIPYGMPGQDVSGVANNAMLRQMLTAKGAPAPWSRPSTCTG